MADSALDELVDRAAGWTDEDVDNLPFMLRWPVQFALGLFLSTLVNGTWLFLGTAVAVAVHSVSGDLPALPPYSPLALMTDPDAGARFGAYGTEALVLFIGWLVVNLVLQGGLRLNAIGRIAVAIPGGLVALLWGGWYAFVLGFCALFA